MQRPEDQDERDGNRGNNDLQHQAHAPVIAEFVAARVWALQIAILAGVLLLTAVGLALWQKAASWRGLGAAALATLVTAGVSGFAVNAIWKCQPKMEMPS